MSIHRIRGAVHAISGLILAGLVAAPVPAIGYLNVPGNFCQWNGYGCSGGYHAPFVLGPMSPWGFCSHNVHRLPCAPSPYCNTCDYGCANCGYGCSIDQPTTLEPVSEPIPTPSPDAGPTLAPTPSAFRLPFRY